MRRLSVLLGLAGLALGTALIGWYGAGTVARQALSVGLTGFALVCAWQGVLFLALGFAWAITLTPAERRSAWLLVWGRMVRDAAANCLPFAQLGGFLAGARAIVLHGVPWPLAAASTAVDLAAEFLAQIVLVATGLAILVLRHKGAALVAPMLAGLAIALVAGLAFLWFQRGGRSGFGRLAARLLRLLRLDATGQIAAIEAALAAIYAQSWRVAACFTLHLAAWFGTGVASWIAYRLLGGHLDLPGALAVEALLHAALALAVFVPGYAGVQEAAYAAIGALFGQPPATSLAVSVLRRARDLALGIPILLIWQALELRGRVIRRQTAA